MTPFLAVCFIAGMLIAIPVWIISQRFGSRHGGAAARRFDPRDAVPCVIEPVALKGRLMPDLQAAPQDDGDAQEGGP